LLLPKKRSRKREREREMENDAVKQDERKARRE